MARKSPFVIQLSREERRQLEARARRYTLSYRDVVRAKIVLLAAEGLGNDEIFGDAERDAHHRWQAVATHRSYDEAPL